MEYHVDPNLSGSDDEGRVPQPPSSKKVVRRKSGAAGDTGAAAAALGAGGAATQVVDSETEANALVKRIRQLESEGAMLAGTLTKICDENGRLTGQLAEVEKRLHEVAQVPLGDTPVLRSLFEPEKTGWFGGSKSAAREQLQQLTEALQSEFNNYKAAHSSTNDEVQALVEGLHTAHTNAQELSKVLQEQQQLVSAGPLKVSVQIIPSGTNAGGGSGAELARLQSELQSVKVENLRLKSMTTVPSMKPDVSGELAAIKAENARLQASLTDLRRQLAASEEQRRSASEKAANMEHMAQAKQTVHAEELSDLRRQLADSFSASMACRNCDDLRHDVEAAKAETAAAQQTVQDLRQQLLDNTVKYEKKYSALERRLADSQGLISEKDLLLSKSMSSDQYHQIEGDKNSLTRELELCKQRIAFLEKNNGNRKDNGDPGDSLDEEAVLDTLAGNKERISKLEYEMEQMHLQLQQAKTYALGRDAAAKKLEETAADDKQRISFLLKKCATLTADVRSSTAQLDAFKEQFEQQALELKQEKRKTESMGSTQKQFEDMKKEKLALEDRLASTKEVEDRLVKAKETIAYMELSQNSSISMSQYAEVKAEKEKLQNMMDPMQRKLDEANTEIARLKAVTDAQHAISTTQNTNVRTWQEQLEAANANETRLRDKVATLTAENTRLQQLNASLETQMNNMQDGIKEMAVHMEQDRSSAKATAEAGSKKEVDSLKEQLEKAQATLATIQATKGEYVADGLYKSVVAERDTLSEDNKKKGFEVEKLKSEILIYRQTIADLEQENDEHVKEFEAMQDRFQSERAGLSDRLSKEQKRSAELNNNAMELKEQLEELQAKQGSSGESIKGLEEKNAKQLRAFEDKCRSEEALRKEIASLKAAAAAAPVAPPVVAAPEPVNTTEEMRLLRESNYQLRQDNERLTQEVAQVKAKSDVQAVEDKEMIQILQTHIKNSMSSADRTAYDVEINRSNALRKSNESLLLENENLKHQLASRPNAPSAKEVTSSYGGVVSPASMSAHQADVIQLQAQLEAQKSTFDMAMQKATSDAEEYQARIAELEEELEHVNATTANPSMAVSVAQEAAPGDLDGGDSPRPTKKKVKRIKKRKTLAEQVGTMDDGVNILAAGDASNMAEEETAANNTHAADLMMAQNDLKKAKREVDTLRSENANLNATIATLTSQLEEARRDLRSAQEDLDAAEASMDAERKDLQEQIYTLQQERQRSAPSLGSSPEAANSSVTGNKYPKSQHIQEVEMRLRCATDENQRLQGEVKELESQLKRSKAGQPSSPTTVSPDELRRLQKQLREKDAENKVLADQLMPAKEKLVEYMAMADRLGLQYPFPKELEGAAMMRLNAISQDRAMSAPQQGLGRQGTLGTSPPPRQPASSKSKTSLQESFSLR